jgi:hypothetical protein
MKSGMTFPGQFAIKENIRPEGRTEMGSTSSAKARASSSLLAHPDVLPRPLPGTQCQFTRPLGNSKEVDIDET